MKTLLASLLIFIMCTAIAPGVHAELGHVDDGPLGFASSPAFDEFCDPPAPLVTVKLRVPACVDADKNLEYRILVENRSSAQAHRVVVLDRLPANAKFVRASPKPHRTEPEMEWQLGTLKAHACQEITLVLSPTNAEDVTNCVRVQFEHGVCATTRQVGSSPRPKLPGDAPIPKDKKPTTDEPPLAAGARLQVNVKGPSKQSINEPAIYVITVTNVGNEPARELSIETQLPKKLTFIRASNKGDAVDGKVGWSLGTLQAKASRSVELVVRAREVGEFCIKTRAEFGEPKLETFTDFKEKCTTFTGIAGLLLEMRDRDDPIPVNGTTSYPIRVVNQGSGPLTNLRIKAVVPNGMALLRVSGPVNHEVKGKTIFFEPLAALEPGAKAEYEVFTRALTAGDLRFKIELTADQLKEGGPVREEESTTVYSEDLPFAAQMQSWLRKRFSSQKQLEDGSGGSEEPLSQNRNSSPTLAPCAQYDELMKLKLGIAPPRYGAACGNGRTASVR
jgi:uncharacterized repeat protein (TIGR01451 family)